MGRVVVPLYPHHIIQRGHNRNVVFASESDFRYYLDTLTEFKELCGVYVYAYCLMTNHVLCEASHKTWLGIRQYAHISVPAFLEKTDMSSR